MMVMPQELAGPGRQIECRHIVERKAIERESLAIADIAH